MIIYIDDYSRMVWGYMLETKSADEKICVVFKQFKAMVEGEKPRYRIQRLRCDQRIGEYTNRQSRAILKSFGIILELSAPYTQHQNGVSERKIQSIENATTSMMHASGLAQEFWAECASTAIYLRNRSPTAAPDNNIPCAMWYGRKLDLQYISGEESCMEMHICWLYLD